METDTSPTNPLRLVADSTIKNYDTGPAVRDLWPKGPNSMSNLLKVTLRKRCYSVALVSDLSKEYPSIRTSEKESKMKFVRSGQETRYINSNIWNQARIKKDLFKYFLTGQETRIFTINIPFQEENEII